MLPNNEQIRESLRRANNDTPSGSDLLRFARAVWCDEIPGLTFAIFTLAWIVISFAGLAGLHPKPAGHQVMAHVHRLALHLPLHAANILSRAGTVAGIARRGWNLLAGRDCA